MPRTLVGFLVLALSQAAASADLFQQCADQRADDYLGVTRTRAFTVQPPHRAGPVRYLNISDEEVREVQAAASEVVGKVLVTIAEVTETCPCEDGDACTDQVWVLAYLPSGTVGLSLSKIGGHWTIGTVQRWWLQHDNLARINRRGYFAFIDAEHELLKHFPTCGLDKGELKKIERKYDNCAFAAEKAAREHP